jgi:hypothetical protein
METKFCSEKFKAILDNPKTTERDIHSFLKQYPYVVIKLFNISWNYYICVPEFRFGNDFRADFLILSADSGSWQAAFIELEGAHDEIMLKDKTPSKKLRIAQKQISQWDTFFRNHLSTVRHDLAKILKDKDIPALNKLAYYGGNASAEIENPTTNIFAKYHIVIGRRSKRYSDKDMESCPGFGYGEKIVTYDRLLDAIVEIEQNSFIADHEGYLRSNTSSKMSR